ncbi:hypothetical protein LCGC14_1472560 [marine sediment metagenome]|uniref:Polymerase beta nucleotidyltransferase domain-containing protein n=1 Tax=marine sediment metagenome TaxID=412755 RepID=A0A0F9JBY0_9ZZZZ
MEQYSRELKRVVGYFKEMEEVSALYVYGGIGSGQYAGPGYGVGVLSSLRDPMALRSLELDCRVQCDDILDVVCLDTASVGLRHHVARCGSVVYERNRARRVRFESRAMNTFDDQIVLGYGLGPELASEIVLDMLEDDMGF